MLEKSKVGFILFIIFVIIFVIGGYFLTTYFIDSNIHIKYDKEIKEIEKEDFRIDKTKDYIYFEDRNYPISNLYMKYQNIFINISNYKYLEEELNNSEKKLAEQIVYVSEGIEINEGAPINQENIFSLKYREYETIEYKEYLSLISFDFKYDINNLITPLSFEIYTFNKENNKLVSEEDLLNKFNISINTVTDKVKETVEAKAYVDDKINVDETMNNLDYVLYINKVGELEIMYLLISTSASTYDTLVIN